MVIDVILDRKYFEELREQGVTQFRGLNGEVIENRYDPSEFYCNVREYGEIAFGITAAIDYGTEEDVQRECALTLTTKDIPKTSASTSAPERGYRDHNSS